MSLYKQPYHFFFFFLFSTLMISLHVIFPIEKSSWRETTQGHLSFSKHWKWNVLLSFCRIAINKKCHSFKLLDTSLCPVGFITGGSNNENYKIDFCKSEIDFKKYQYIQPVLSNFSPPCIVKGKSLTGHAVILASFPRACCWTLDFDEISLKSIKIR